MTEYEKTLEPLIEKKLTALGYFLVKLGVYHGKNRKKIDLVIYASGGITHTDCRKVTKALMDDADIEANFGEDYLLEVSSPGIDRKLSRLKDFLIFSGKTVEYAMKDDGTPLFGKIEGVKDERVIIYDFKEKKATDYTMDDIAYAKLSDFNGGK